MPEIGRIQSTNFQSLLTDLGITRNNIPFGLQSEVMPVVLVGGTVSFVAAPTPPYRVPSIFSAGIVTAPAAGTVLADTGQLPLGVYGVTVWMHNLEATTGAGVFELQWRNVANSANLRAQLFSVNRQSNQIVEVRFQVENDNERFRVINVPAGTAAIDYQVTILAQL